MGFKNFFRKDPAKVLADGKLNYTYRSDLQTFKVLPNFRIFLDQLTIKHNNQIGLYAEGVETAEGGLLAGFHYPVYNLDKEPVYTFFFIIQSMKIQNRIAFAGTLTEFWNTVDAYDPPKMNTVLTFEEKYHDLDVSSYAIHHEEIYKKSFAKQGIDIRNYTRQGSNFLGQVETRLRNNDY